MLFRVFFVSFRVFLQIRKHFKKLIKHRLRISAFWLSDLVVCIVSEDELLGIVGIMVNYVFSNCAHLFLYAHIY